MAAGSPVDVPAVEAITGGADSAEAFLSPEEKEAALMRDLLDDGKNGEALRHARNLMDSDDRRIRAAALDAFQWMGKRAMPEITEMMNDANDGIANDALTAWELALSEIDGERRQAEAMENAAVRMKTPALASAVLMHFSAIEPEVALPALARIIESNKGGFVGECAREIYSHVTGGEIYASAAVKQPEGR